MIDLRYENELQQLKHSIQQIKVQYDFSAADYPDDDDAFGYFGSICATDFGLLVPGISV